MFRYTIMRLGIFFGVLLVAWLLGLRSDPALLLLVSAVVSVVLSFFLLRRQRDEFSERIAAKIEQRQEVRRAAATDGPGEETDEAFEDAEVADVAVQDEPGRTPRRDPRP
ncbi:MAG: DUF4229 domain-containing protein [Lapillicoccus sp.]